MRCRCADIKKVNHDIDTCNSAESDVGKLSQFDDTLANDARLLSSSLGSTATPKNLSSLTSKASQLDKNLASKRLSLTGAISSKKKQLNDQLTSLQSEDRSYHGTHPGS
jgi:hypothetical protein